MHATQIRDVSDTALWVAHYRAEETDRADALFHDPLARLLSGERGRVIAAEMEEAGRYTRWTVVIRTVIIDRFIEQLLASKKIDLVINLGAGLDTRPYRMKLPADLEWIEVDHEKMLDYKNDALQAETPVCKLTRIGLDLANDQKRQKFFSEFSGRRVLVITEGVIPYLTLDEATRLARDLHATKSFLYWIAEYISPEVYPQIQKRLKKGGKMRNAPFLFSPGDWIGFFETNGWTPQQMAYTGEVSDQLGRRSPFPWIVKVLSRFAPKSFRLKMQRMMGFMLLEKK